MHQTHVILTLFPSLTGTKEATSSLLSPTVSVALGVLTVVVVAAAVIITVLVIVSHSSEEASQSRRYTEKYCKLYYYRVYLNSSHTSKSSRAFEVYTH